MTTRTLLRAGMIAVALLAPGAPPAQGQTQVDAEMVPFVGGNFFVADARAPFVISSQEGAQLTVQDGRLRNAPAFGFSAGMRFADRWGFEGMFAWVPTRLEGQASVPERRRVADVSSVRYGVSALHHFGQRGPVRPFAGVAVNAETLSYEPYATWERETSTALGITAGAQLPVSDRLAMRVQAMQDVVGRAGQTRREQLLLTVGLSWRQRVR
jgi:hypothetical protein